MARMLHRKGKPAGASQRAFLAVAAYQDLGAGFTYSLFHSGQALQAAGIETELAIYSGNCHVDDGRNRLVHEFLKSDCTDLVFIDADVGWFAADLVKLLGYDRDVVAGIYPKKHGDDTFPVKLLPGEIWSDADGLIEVQGAPTGFLRIRRAVFERLAEKAERYNARNDAANGVACIFERQIHNGSRWGGDYVFCRKWREMGGRIFVDPVMRFEHSGEHTWSGSVGAWLRQRAGIGLAAGLEAIGRGAETPEDVLELLDAWANPFAGSPLMLLGLAAIVRNRPGLVLECGSGLSSLVMAAAAPSKEIHVLENSPVFAEHLRIEANRYGLDNIVIHCRPLKDGWYDIGDLPGYRWGIALIDGPPRKDGRRMAAFDRLDLTEAVIVADDVQSAGGLPEMIDALRRTHEVVVIGDAQREFAIAAPRKSPQMKTA